MHAFDVHLVGIRLGSVGKSSSVVQRKLHPVGQDVSRHKGVLSVVEAQRVDADKLVIDDEVVVRPRHRHTLAFQGVRNFVVSDVV